MKTIDKVYSSVSKNILYIDLKPHDSGCQCRFIRYSKLRGIKLYLSLEEAVRSFERQKFLSEKGLSPRVYGNVFAYCVSSKKNSSGKVDKYNTSFYFGFKTRRAKLIHGNKKLLYIQKDIDDLYDNVKKLWKDIPYTSRFSRDLGDFHMANLGYINSDIVLIDTGDDTFGYY